jgi:signal transduction protein with GAF and PtsI domain
MASFNNIVRSVVQFGSDRKAALGRALDEILTKFRAETGTVHLLDPAKNVLVIAAARNVPPPVVELTKEIPLGKGIAGECAATGKPVTICNLQKDDGGGVAKPGAKQTGVGGALCVPMIVDGRIVGTLGIGTRKERTYAEEEVTMLTSVAKVLGEELAA